MNTANQSIEITPDERAYLIALRDRFKAEIESSGARVQREVIMFYDVDIVNDTPTGFALGYFSLPNEMDTPQTTYSEHEPCPVPVAFFDGNSNRLPHKIEKISEGEYEGQYEFRVQLVHPVPPGERMELFSKPILGDEDWLSVPTHARMVQRDEPAVLETDTFVSPGTLLARCFRLPRGCKLYECFEEPRELWAEGDRLNLLYVFYGSRLTVQMHKIYAQYLLP